MYVSVGCVVVGCVCAFLLCVCLQVESTFFKQQPDVKVIGGTVTVSVPVDSIITLSTVVTAGGAIPSPAPSAPFPTSYSDSFESYAVHSEAKYFADQGGSFEVVQSGQANHGLVMRQMVRARVCV